MNRTAAALCFSLLLGTLLVPAHAQDDGRGNVHVPDSSLVDPNDFGQRAHTNHRILVDRTGTQFVPGGKSPVQIRTVYNLPPSGGSGIIAIVDAFDYPNALRDFNMFSKQFGLPQETSTGVTSSLNQVLQVMYEGGVRPRSNTGWNQEAALDIQWAHALAPNAKIVLVEAQSNSYDHLFAAVDLAVSLHPAQISLSWGGSEGSGQTAYDYHLNVAGPIFFAATGDQGGVTSYPSTSPYVVAVGGTSVTLNADGTLNNETGWSGGGGGTSSVYTTVPDFQSGLGNIVTGRGVPDLAADADPNTGVAVYAPINSKTSTWMVFGGTSVSTPCMAAMVNLAPVKYVSTTAFLQAIYSTAAQPNFRDITAGNNGFPCLPGWDFVTGLGAPKGTGF
jgi:subtilase family serine protease